MGSKKPLESAKGEITMTDDGTEPDSYDLELLARHVTYDREGKPISMERFVELYDDQEYKRVAFDQVTRLEEAIMVSTVWLGIDHGFGATRHPIIFETQVFGGSLDRQCWRYSTEAEARIGHAIVLRKIRQTRTSGEAKP